MEIKIIGSEFSVIKKIKKEIKKIAKKQKLDISIQEINDKNNIRKYKVLQTPTLVINDEYKYEVEKIDYNLLKRLLIFCSLV
ncbi:MAG: thioredoxin family protein [Bacilli bacterium]|nr:thioredoxin family protein [Bacilli bacterium]